jgi:uncharacterized protein YjdB
MTFTFKLAKRIARNRTSWPRIVAAIILLAGCADAMGTEPTDQSFPDSASSSLTVASVTITPGTAAGAVGATAQFSAIARDAGGQVVTGRSVSWSTTNTAVVAISSTGFARAAGGGSAQVTAKIGGVVGRANVTVSGTKITVASVVVTPGAVSTAVGQSVQLGATVKDAAGAILSGVKVIWQSNNTAIVSVDTLGVVRALRAGIVEVIATTGPKTGRATITVTAGSSVIVGSVTVTPGTAAGAVGDAAQFSAEVKDATGNVMTGQSVTWRSTNSAVISVTTSGYATAVGGGTAAIVATTGGKSGQATITVTGATQPPATGVASVTITPGSTSGAIGAIAQLSAAVKDANGNALSGQAVTWSSSAPSLVSVTGTGLVTALLAGNVTITATSGGKSGTATVSVTGGVTPPQPPPSGSEPMFQSGQRLIWKDTFNGGLSDAAVLGNYITLNPQYIHADASAGLSGTGALRFDWQASSGCQDQSRLIEQGIEPTREIYVTYTIRYTPNFQYDWRNSSGCSGNAKKLFFLYAVSGSRFDFISENHFLGMGSDYDHPLFSQNQGGTMAVEQLGDGNWHRITIHVVQSSTPTATDGVIEGWIDGVQRWSYRNVASNASGGWNYFHFPSTFNQGSPATQSEWIDDLTVWKP